MATSLAICKIFEQVYKILLQDVPDFDASQPASFLQEPYVWGGTAMFITEVTNETTYYMKCQSSMTRQLPNKVKGS